MILRAQIFVVRIWFESAPSTPTWRASVTNANTQERRFFSSAERLTAFLMGASIEPEPSQNAPKTSTGLEDA